jgi:hypothetical protein
MPGEDFHLSDHLRFQAHHPVATAPGSVTSAFLVTGGLSSGLIANFTNIPLLKRPASFAKSSINLPSILRLFHVSTKEVFVNY